MCSNELKIILFGMEMLFIEIGILCVKNMFREKRLWITSIRKDEQICKNLL